MKVSIFQNVIVLDDVPGVFGSPEEHDIPVWTWSLPDVRRPDVRVSYLQKGRGKKDLALLGSLVLLR